MKKGIITSVLFFISGSVFVYAADADSILTKVVTEIINPLYRLAVALSFLYFLYGVVKYMHDLRNPEDKNTGKAHLLWGTVGLFIIFSVGGIMNVFTNMFGALGSN